MKKNDVKVGGVYAAKITDKVVPVRIDAENPHGGWDGTNLATKKKVRIRSPRKLRGEVAAGGDMAATSAKGQAAATTKAKAPGAATGATRAATGARKPRAAKGEATGGKKATRANDGGREKSRKPMGVLDAAAQILAKAKEPMSCKAIVEQALAQGLWSTAGQTPHATLYAAVIREIARKGKGARFEKVDRGRFRLRKGDA